MKRVFVTTENTKRFMSALDALKNRGAGEACLMVIDGIPGLGKTEALQYCATRSDWVFVRAKKEWSPSWMMKELLAEIGVKSPPHTFEHKYKIAIETLIQRAEAATRANEDFAVVIDEVDYISRNSRIMETIRDLSDMLEIPFIMVGMGKVRHHLTRFPQIASRVGQYVEFKPADLTDVQALVSNLCEVQVDPTLVEYLHKTSKGLIREIKEAIINIERHGKLNGGLATLDSMQGQILLNDRATGRPIRVC